MPDYSDYKEGVKANDQQVGGKHYGTHAHQHWDYCWERGFDQFQYAITKYVERHKQKNGRQDLEKAGHYLDKYIELLTSGGHRPTHVGIPSGCSTMPFHRYYVERDMDDHQMAIFWALEDYRNYGQKGGLERLAQARQLLVRYVAECYPA